MNSIPKRRTAQPRAVEGLEPSGPDDDLTIPVIEEQLSIEVVPVAQGGYRITKRVRELQEVVDELLHDVQVVVERRPMGTLLEVLEAPPQRQEGETWVFPVVKEVVVTQKRLMLVEEIRVTRVHGTHRAPQTMSVRVEEVSIEKLTPEPKRRKQPASKRGRKA